MKIGVMTWWRNTNYGGFLQGLALQTFLQKNGFDVEMVRYAFPPVRFSAWSVVCSRRITSLRQFLAAVVDIFRALFINGGLFARMRRLKKNCRLVDKYIRSSPRQYASLSDINQNRRYDAILIGSDQVWTPFYHDTEFSYLLRGIDNSVLKVSYAASVSAPSVHPYEQIYAEALARFDAISVREKTNVEELEKLSGKKVEWVVDPTLLLSADEWRQLMNLNTTTDEQHITFYCLSPFDGRVSELIKLAKGKGMRVHIFTDVQAFCVGTNPLKWFKHLVARLRIAYSPWLKLRLDADAREWLQDISTADFVVSDSFHALMFARIFGRKIDVELPVSRQKMSSRIKDFQLREKELPCWQDKSRRWLLESIRK